MPRGFWKVTWRTRHTGEREEPFGRDETAAREYAAFLAAEDDVTQVRLLHKDEYGDDEGLNAMSSPASYEFPWTAVD